MAQLFEHKPQILTLSPEEKNFLESLSFRKKSIVEYCKTVAPNKYQVKIKNYVGTVLLSEGKILELLPKFPEMNLQTIIGMMYFSTRSVAWKDHDVELWLQSNTHTSHMVEGFSLVFIKEVQQIVAHGLCRGYVKKESTGTNCCGEINFARQIERNPGIQYFMEMDRYELSEDVIENQVIRYVLEQLIQKLQFGNSHVLHLLYALLENFVHVQSFVFDTFPEIQIHPMNAHYTTCLQLARQYMIEGLPSNLYSSKMQAFIEYTPLLVQHFIINVLRNYLNVSETELLHESEFKYTNFDYIIRPDILWLRHGTCVFIGDVKYKAKERSSDVHQMLAYLVSQQVRRGMILLVNGLNAVPKDIRISGTEYVVLLRHVKVGELTSMMNQLRVLAQEIYHISNINFT